MKTKDILASLYQCLIQSATSTAILLIILFLYQENSLADDSSIIDNTEIFNLDIDEIINIVRDEQEIQNEHTPGQFQSLPSTPTTANSNILTEGPLNAENKGQESFWDDFWEHYSPFIGKPLLAIAPPQPEKPAAYIMLGDIKTTQTEFLNYLDYLPSPESFKSLLTGNRRKDVAIRATMQIATKAREALSAAGYKIITVNLHATSNDLKTVLRRPSTGAIIWVSHGIPGQIFDSSGDQNTRRIDEYTVKKWVLELLQEKGIYKEPSTYRYPSKMFSAMREIENKAHFGLNYFYAHSCLTMKEPKLALRVIDSSGRYEGYWRVKLAYIAALTPAVSDISNNEFPSVHDILVVPDIIQKSSLETRVALDIAEARLAVGNAGFTAKVIEDKENKNKAGTIYSQTPAPGTILNRKKDSKEVILHAYKKLSNTNSSSTGTSLPEDRTKYMIWINQFGKAGRIHVGTVDAYKTPRKYTNEWLAGKSQEHLKKQETSGGQRFEDKKSAKKAACAIISNARHRGSLGWGPLSIGDFQGKTYYIDGLACEIKPAR